MGKYTMSTTTTVQVSVSDVASRFQEKPRLALAREYFLSERGLDDLTEANRWYGAWVARSEYLLLKREEAGKAREYFAAKCSKRGNDVYEDRVKARLRSLTRKLGAMGRSKGDKSRNQKTSVVAVTLTWAGGATSVRTAWERITPEWNRWKAGIRKRFGAFSSFRVLESSQKGYPHLHAILCFSGHTFPCFRHVAASGRVSYRVAAKSYFETGWSSFVDVEAVTSTQHMVGYFTKYLTKGHGKSQTYEVNGQKVEQDSLTLCLNWLFRKRSFAVSRTLQPDLIANLHNSNQSGYGQQNLFGQTLVKWTCLGVWYPQELGITDGEWSQTVDDAMGYAAEVHRNGKLAADTPFYLSPS